MRSPSPPRSTGLMGDDDDIDDDVVDDDANDDNGDVDEGDDDNDENGDDGRQLPLRSLSRRGSRV